MTQFESEVREAMLTVKDSSQGVRAEILAYLRESPFSSPSEILDHVEAETGTSQSGFYNNLEVLREEELVTRIGGSGRATMYELTDLGEQVVENLGLGQTDPTKSTDTVDSLENEIDRLLETYDVTPAELVDRLEKRREIRQR